MRARLVRLKFSTVEKSGGGHVAQSANRAEKRKHATQSAATAGARAMALERSSGALCAVPNAAQSPPCSVVEPPPQHRQPVTSPLGIAAMARSSLLLALVIFVAAALFAQLPLASAAACAPAQVCIAPHAKPPAV